MADPLWKIWYSWNKIILPHSTQNLKSKLFLMFFYYKSSFREKNSKIIHFLSTNPSFAFKHDIQSCPILTARRCTVERIIVVVFLIFCFVFYLFIFYLFSFYCYVGFKGAMRFNPHHGISWSMGCNNIKSKFCKIFSFGLYSFWYSSIEEEANHNRWDKTRNNLFVWLHY